MAAATVFAALFAACGGQASSEPSFTIQAVPAATPLEVRAVIPGQQTSFLVGITDSGPGGGAALVSATATLASVDRVTPSTIKAGQVAEVWLTADPTLTSEATATVTIAVSRGQLRGLVERKILITPMSSEGRERDARPYFEYWTAWLAEHHADLGITAGTDWRPQFVSTLLVVSHMSYYSDAWELGLSWHAGTIPPNDWSQIYLRHRATEMRPSISFKLDSFTAKTEPYAVPPPDSVVR